MRMLIAIGALALLTVSGPARSAEINALITTAMKDAIDGLAQQFEKETGHKVNITYGPSGGLKRRYDEGRPADMIMVASTEIDDMIKQGTVAPGRTDVAQTGIGICVKKGAPHPDVSTPEALKAALLAAKSVGHTAPAGGGITAKHVQNVFVRLGIADQVTPKVKLAAGGPNGRVSVLVSSGEADIGLQQISELMTNPGVDVIGLLPRELQQITIYSAGVIANAKQPDAAKAFIKYLAAPPAKAIYKTKGLDIS